MTHETRQQQPGDNFEPMSLDTDLEVLNMTLAQVQRAYIAVIREVRALKEKVGLQQGLLDNQNARIEQIEFLLGGRQPN